MPKFNDFDMSNWKEIDDIDVGSLWIIDKRKKDEYNSNNYHGNFVPQIPEHFIKRFTHSGDVVLDPFIGSGTTIFEACRLDRKAIGVDLTPRMFEWINSKNIDEKLYSLIEGDSLSKETYSVISKILLEKFNTNKVQLLVLHPPYHDIIKFSDKENDMSNCKNVDDFLLKFEKMIDNLLPLLEDNRYCVLVMGDKYENSQWIPLAFYCMNVLINKGLILKGTIIKNSVNTKGKAGSDNIWKYRALASDYYLFKHEYIFLFKKVKAKKGKKNDN